MKSIFCFALVIAAALAVEKDAPENILKDTTATYASTSTPSTQNFVNFEQNGRGFSFGTGRTHSTTFNNDFNSNNNKYFRGFTSGNVFASSPYYSGVFQTGNSVFSKQQPAITTRFGVNSESVSTEHSTPEHSKEDEENVSIKPVYTKVDGHQEYIKSGLFDTFNNYGYGVQNSFADGGLVYGNLQYASPYVSGVSHLTGYGQQQLAGAGRISNVDTQVRVDTTQHKHVNTLHTVTKQVPVPQPYPVPYQVTKTVAVPQPYPVHVVKAVPVPYNVRVPVPVDKPVPVHVPNPVPVPVHVKVPVPVEKPYPVPVEKTVRVPVERPVYVRVPHPVPVKVAQPYPVRVAKPVPVQVPTPVVVKVPEVIKVHKTEYAVAPTVHHNFGLESGHLGHDYHYADAISHSGYNDAIASQVQSAHLEAAISGGQYGFDNAHHIHDGSYQIHAANLVGAYQYPVAGAAYFDHYEPVVEDARFAFKRAAKDDKKKTDEKKDTKQ